MSNRIKILVVAGIIIALGAKLGPMIAENPDLGEQAAQRGERKTVQTAILLMMVGNYLSSVKPSVSRAGGEKIHALSTQFHETANLKDYMDQDSTNFCYRWQSDGRITFQYDVDDDGNCAVDAEQLFPLIRSTVLRNTAPSTAPVALA